MTIEGIIWLECPKCGVKEWLQVNTRLPLEGCPQCGTARFAVDDNGIPHVVWANIGNPTKWEPDSSAGCVDLSEVDWKVPEQ